MAFGSRIREFDLSENSSWVDYVERIELSCAANKLTTDDDKRAVLLSCCGPETYSLIATLVKLSRPPNVGYQVIVDAVKKHINPKPSELYSRTMDTVLAGMPHVATYLDDILIASESIEEHERMLAEVLSRLAKSGLGVQAEKRRSTRASGPRGRCQGRSPVVVVPSRFSLCALLLPGCAICILRHFAFLCVARWKAAKTQSKNVWAAAENQLQRVKHAAEGGLEGLPTTLHLAVIGSSMGDIKKIIVAVDSVEFISTRSLEKAMGLLLGAFFVFKVAYPPDCPLTMEFLQRYLGQINPTKGRGKGRACGIAPKLLSLLQAL
ncbi:uncharacterized protein LOC144121521 [Amblyomma americanum]